MSTEIRSKAFKFLESERVGVVSTVFENKPESAYVYYTHDDDFIVYFTTLTGSRKHKNLQLNNNISFAIGSAKPPLTLQIDGTAELVTGTKELMAVTYKYIKAALDNIPFASPVVKLSEGEGIAVYKITPKWIRWSDFSKEKIAGEEGTYTVILDEE